jgi:hypothetical protein
MYPTPPPPVPKFVEKSKLKTKMEIKGCHVERMMLKLTLRR